MSTSSPAQTFSQRVRQRFGRHAAHYERHAQLQRAVAWRLARHGRGLALPPGPRADLGAGSGLLSSALLAQGGQWGCQPLRQIDLCPELLARNPVVSTCNPPWLLNLNEGLPASLLGAAALVSSFALQWLEDPLVRLREWCLHLAPGGWLLLAVPTASSFPQWHRAAAAATVPCTALPLPRASSLLSTIRSAGVEPWLCRHLRFSRPASGGLPSLRQLQRLGAGASRLPPLSRSQLRHLLAHWPADEWLTWNVLVLIARRRRCS